LYLGRMLTAVIKATNWTMKNIDLSLLLWKHTPTLTLRNHYSPSMIEQCSFGFMAPNNTSHCARVRRDCRTLCDQQINFVASPWIIQQYCWHR
jgi:hypothetical protein